MGRVFLRALRHRYEQGGLFTKVALVVVIVVFCEVFIFNGRYWESRGYDEVQPEGASLSQDEDGNWIVELTGINAPVGNVFISDEVVRPDTDRHLVRLEISADDEAHTYSFTLPPTQVVAGNAESEYIRVYLEGNVTEMSISFSGAVREDKLVESVHLNVPRPLILRVWRVTLLLLIGVLMLAFRPSSGLYDIELSWKEARCRLAIGLALAVCVAAVAAVGVSFRHPRYSANTDLSNNQYNILAESLLEGHAWLGMDPPETLNALDNPYDPVGRAVALNAAGESAVLDYAWWGGRYWSYFGVVPAILFFMPWQLATGRYLATQDLVLGLSCFYPLCIFWLLYTLIKRHRIPASLGSYLLAAGTISLAGGILYFVQVPAIYSVPIVCALLFDLLGLTCWLQAAPPDGGAPRKGWLLGGALLLALVMGCRPQLSIVFLLAFPIFWSQIRQGWFFSRSGAANTACVIAPFVVIGTMLMWYNWIRFGNPFDFGARYNITSFDMTHQSFALDRFPLGIWEYLFQPIKILPAFPYLYVIAYQGGLANNFQGQVINEPLMGGFFAVVPFGLMLLGLWPLRQRLREHGLLGISVGLVAVGLVAMAIDTQVVGMTLRYLSEFSTFLCIPAAIVALFVLGDGRRATRTFLGRVIVALAAFSVMLAFAILLADGRYNSLLWSSPGIYYRLKFQLFSILGTR